MNIDGKLIAELINTKSQITLNACTFNRRPKLQLFIVGNRKDSLGYIRQKQKKCAEFDIVSDMYQFDVSDTFDFVLEKIKEANTDPSVDGIILQMPLPQSFLYQASEEYPHIDLARKLIDAIDPSKDVDGLTTLNIGKYVADFGHNNVFIPATAAGVMKILEYIDFPLAGKNVVIIGRSLIVGKPLAMLLLQKDAAVTILHSKVADLSYYTKHADVLISAVGKIALIKKDMVKDGAVVIDVGMTKNEANKFRGDIDYEQVKERASFITPVPGGVGPLTVAFIISNLVKAYIQHNESKTEYLV